MAPHSPALSVQHPFRSTRRITITVPHATFEALEERSSHEGRSLSNLAAYLLESSLDGPRTHGLPAA